MSRKLFHVLFTLAFLGMGVTKLGADLESVVTPGLKLSILKAAINATSVAVTFQITDNAGQGLDRLGLQTAGPVSTSFVLARIKPGDTQYTNYLTNLVTATPVPGCKTCTVGGSWNQPVPDSGGTYTSVGNGVYTYTFGNQLPANPDMDSTTTVGMFAQRDLTAFGFPLATLANVANATFDFVPSGAPVTQVRDVVSTAACNQCHDPLAHHDGLRRDVRLCVLCHNPGNQDPYTGNSLDFKVYIHKIHMGVHKPSESGQPLNILGYNGLSTATVATGGTPAPQNAGYVPPGKPYQIVGAKQTLNDFSSIVYPQDVRNCTTCHQQGKQSDNWMNNPSRAACGSCHVCRDRLRFAAAGDRRNHSASTNPPAYCPARWKNPARSTASASRLNSNVMGQKVSFVKVPMRSTFCLPTKVADPSCRNVTL